MAFVSHPESGKLIQGERLPAGEAIRSTDVFSAASGYWLPAGDVIVATGAFVPSHGIPRCAWWVRPRAKEGKGMIKHRISGVEIEGIRLEAGTPLLPTDVYDRTDGTWAPNPGTGNVPTGDHVVWVRTGSPETETDEGPE